MQPHAQLKPLLLQKKGRIEGGEELVVFATISTEPILGLVDLKIS